MRHKKAYMMKQRSICDSGKDYLMCSTLIFSLPAIQRIFY